MKVLGIIAEYNPFHLGHQYQIDQAKKTTNADYVIVIMSGSFVQRGTLAIADKYTRAKTALCCGADMILELPCLYATASAETFAKGAVSTLNSLGVVTHLSFGSETTNSNDYEQLAKILNNEPKQYKTTLREYLSKGISYPKARFLTLEKHFPQYSYLLSENSPNTILGIEYCKALLELNSEITPVIVKRCGGGYHTKEKHSLFSSATSIRHQLSDSNENTVLLSSVQSQIPEPSYDSLLSAYGHTFPMSEDDLSAHLRMALFQVKDCDYTSFLDVTQDLSNRIRKNLYEFVSFHQFAELLKTKDMTYTRICRCLIHILLGITDSLLTDAKNINYVPYYRVLGIKKEASSLLSAIKKSSSLPIITNPADYLKKTNQQDSLPMAAKNMLNNDIYATNLFNCICADKFHTKTECELTRPFLKLID